MEAESVRLSHEPDFALGEFRVRPSLREMGWNGRREQLEPRVMQVLVTLARASGAVVSRDELIERLLGSINRCISKLRERAVPRAID